MHFLWGQNVPYVTVPYVTRHFSKQRRYWHSPTYRYRPRNIDIYRYIDFYIIYGKVVQRSHVRAGEYLTRTGQGTGCEQ